MSQRASHTSLEDEPVAGLSAALRSAIGRAYTRFRSERGEGEIGDAALYALNALHKDGPLALKELSDRAHVTPGSMSQTVNRLTALGYAVRRPDPSDGRRVLFAVTPTGSALALAALTRRVNWLDAALNELTPEERAVLDQAATILQKIADR